MEELYSHYPLNYEKDDIRLLTIPTAPWDSPITVDFSVISLRDKETVKYLAVSYVWGEAVTTETITVASQTFPVTKNIFYALRRLRWHAHRKKLPSLVLWIDFVCICQSDEKEKERQIPLMREIFSRGTCTAIWLGEVYDVEYVDVPQQSPDRPNAKSTWKSTIRTCKQVIDDLAEGKHFTEIELFDNDNSDPHFVNVQRLFEALGSNPWFIRRWVIQETVLAQSVRVHFGDLSIDLSHLSRAMRLYSDHIDRQCCLSSRLGHYDLRQSIRVFLQGFVLMGNLRGWKGSRAHIVELCQMFAKKKTTVDVDCVYSLLGLTKPPSKILPDYSLPLENVMEGIWSEYIEDGNALQFFYLAGLSRGRPGLPSWAIDWTQAHCLWNYVADLFTCGTYWTGSRHIRKRPGHSELHMMVAPVDEVEESFSQHRFTGMTTEEMIKLLLEQDIFSSTYPSGCTWTEAWARTLSADCCYGANAARRLTPEDLTFLFKTVTSKAKIHPRDIVLLAEGKKALADAHLRDIMRMVDNVKRDSCLFYTRKGYIGVAKEDVRSGDRVVLVPDCPLPMVTRAIHMARKEVTKVVGCCYLHGWMDEAMPGVEVGFEELILV